MKIKLGPVLQRSTRLRAPIGPRSEDRLGYLDAQELACATQQMNGVFRQMGKEGTLDAKGADWPKGL